MVSMVTEYYSKCHQNSGDTRSQNGDTLDEVSPSVTKTIGGCHHPLVTPKPAENCEKWGVSPVSPPLFRNIKNVKAKWSDSFFLYYIYGERGW